MSKSGKVTLRIYNTLLSLLAYRCALCFNRYTYSPFISSLLCLLQRQMAVALEIAKTAPSGEEKPQHPSCSKICCQGNESMAHQALVSKGVLCVFQIRWDAQIYTTCKELQAPCQSSQADRQGWWINKGLTVVGKLVCVKEIFSPFKTSTESYDIHTNVKWSCNFKCRSGILCFYEDMSFCC